MAYLHCRVFDRRTYCPIDGINAVLRTLDYRTSKNVFCGKTNAAGRISEWPGRWEPDRTLDRVINSMCPDDQGTVWQLGIQVGTRLGDETSFKWVEVNFTMKKKQAYLLKLMLRPGGYEVSIDPWNAEGGNRVLEELDSRAIRLIRPQPIRPHLCPVEPAERFAKFYSEALKSLAPAPGSDEMVQEHGKNGPTDVGEEAVEPARLVETLAAPVIDLTTPLGVSVKSSGVVPDIGGEPSVRNPVNGTGSSKDTLNSGVDVQHESAISPADLVSVRAKGTEDPNKPVDVLFTAADRGETPKPVEFVESQVGGMWEGRMRKRRRSGNGRTTRKERK